MQFDAIPTGMQVYLVLLEDWIQQYLHQFVPALWRALIPDNNIPRHLNMADEVSQCVQLVGAFTPASVFLGLSRPLITDATAETKARAAAVSMLAAFVRGAAPRHAIDAEIQSLLRLVDDAGMLEGQDSHAKAAVLDLVTAFVQACGPSSLYQNAAGLCRALLVLSAPTDGSNESVLRPRVDALLPELAIIIANADSTDEGEEHPEKQCVHRASRSTNKVDGILLDSQGMLPGSALAMCATETVPVEIAEQFLTQSSATGCVAVPAANG